MTPDSLSGVIQVSVNPEILNWFSKLLFTSLLKMRFSMHPVSSWSACSTHISAVNNEMSSFQLLQTWHHTGHNTASTRPESCSKSTITTFCSDKWLKPNMSVIISNREMDLAGAEGQRQAGRCVVEGLHSSGSLDLVALAILSLLRLTSRSGLNCVSHSKCSILYWSCNIYMQT